MCVLDLVSWHSLMYLPLVMTLACIHALKCVELCLQVENPRFKV